MSLLLYTDTIPNFRYTVNGTEAFVGDDLVPAISTDFAGSLTIPDLIDGRNVTKIGAYAFNSCTKLESVVIPESVRVISNFAFSKSGIQSLVFPSQLEYLGYNCFYLSSIKFADLSNTKLVCPNAQFIFYQSQLETITLPSHLQILPYFMVAESKITQITIPQSLRSIQSGCFEGCHYLNTIISKSPNFVVFMNTLYSPDYKIIYRYPSNGIHDIMPMTDTLSGCGCFSGVNFTTYTIPSGIKFIYTNPFRYCRNLQTLDASKCQVRDVPHAFTHTCYKLTSLLLPQSLISIASDILCYSNSLTFLKIPGTVRMIDNRAFYLSSLSSIEYCGIDTFTLSTPLSLTVSVSSDSRFKHLFIFGVSPLKALTCPPYRTAPPMPRASKTFCFTNKRKAFLSCRGINQFFVLLLISFI